MANNLLKDFKCTNCGITYQALHPYMHTGILGQVCIICMDIYAPESEWA